MLLKMIVMWDIVLYSLISTYCIFMSVSMLKIGAFWDVMLCSLGVDWRFRGAYCLHHHGDALMMEAVCTSETLVYSENTWHCIPEGSNLPSPPWEPEILICTSMLLSCFLYSPPPPKPPIQARLQSSNSPIRSFLALPHPLVRPPIFPPTFLCTAYSLPWWWHNNHLWNEGVVNFMRVHSTISQKAVSFIPPWEPKIPSDTFHCSMSFSTCIKSSIS
jgi:hypothetical protein